MRRTTFFLLPSELAEMEARDDNLLDETVILSSSTLPGAANEPTEDRPAKVDAIYFSPESVTKS